MAHTVVQIVWWAERCFRPTYDNSFLGANRHGVTVWPGAPILEAVACLWLA